MIMMEEFRRRKNLKEYHGMVNEKKRSLNKDRKNDPELPFQIQDEDLKSMSRYNGSNVERYFEPDYDEIFDQD